MSNMRTRNLIAAIILLSFCAGYAYLTANLATRAIENTTQPSFFPWVVVICLTILSVALLIQSFLPSISMKTPKPQGVPTKRLVFGLVLAIVYLALLPILGFAGANIPFFAGLMVLYGERNILKIIISSVAISLFVSYLFREAFQILLPSGILENVL
jgi:putative tricarboxylic transport membrane protein